MDAAHRLEIKAAIIRRGRYQYEVARELGVSENALSKFLRGHGTLRPDQIARLPVILGLEHSITGAVPPSAPEAVAERMQPGEDRGSATRRPRQRRGPAS
jgi:transcriptional regulator with XRE-family HTH domain